MAILSPLTEAEVIVRLDMFRRHLTCEPARHVFEPIAATLDHCPGLRADQFAGRDKAIGCAKAFGLEVRDADPADGFSWDGGAIAARTETTVIFHEIAHWLVAPPARRHLYDFGLGGGPETGRKAEADDVRAASHLEAERDELLASVLGMALEAEAGEPALLAFIDHNWLDDADRPAGARLFEDVVAELMVRGLLSRAGHARPPAVRHVA